MRKSPSGRKAGDENEEDKFYHLGAQIYYRLGWNTKSAEALQELEDFDDGEDGPKEDHPANEREDDRLFLRVNKYAARVAALTAGAPALESEDKELKSWGLKPSKIPSSDFAFNLACAAIQRGFHSEAEAFLDSAERMCRTEIHQADTKVKPDSIEISHPDMAPIALQRAYLFQAMGDNAKAAPIYERLADGESRSDITTIVMALNNNAALDGSYSLRTTDIFKRLCLTAGVPLEVKLSRQQAVVVAANQVLAYAQNGQLAKARDSFQSVAAKHGSGPVVQLVEASLQYHQGSVKKCVKLLGALLKSQCIGSISARNTILILAKICLAKRLEVIGVEAIKGVDEHHLTSDLCVALAAAQLHAAGRDPERAVAIVRRVAEQYIPVEEGLSEDNLQSLGAALRLGAEAALRIKNYEVATRFYRWAFEEVDSDAMESLTGLVRAANFHDSEMAQQYAVRLVQFLGPGVNLLDPEELETGMAPVVLPRSNEKNVPSRRCRKKKIRLPKNFDAQKRPDPERWLPKQERSAYKKMMKKKGAISRGPQGAMPTSDTAFRNTGPSTAHTEAARDVKKLHHRR